MWSLSSNSETEAGARMAATGVSPSAECRKPRLQGGGDVGFAMDDCCGRGRLILADELLEVFQSGEFLVQQTFCFPLGL